MFSKSQLGFGWVDGFRTGLGDGCRLEFGRDVVANHFRMNKVDQSVLTTSDLLTRFRNFTSGVIIVSVQKGFRIASGRMVPPWDR